MVTFIFITNILTGIVTAVVMGWWVISFTKDAIKDCERRDKNSKNIV